MSERPAQGEADRPCDRHPPPSELGAVWCSLCGAFRPTSTAPLAYVSRARCQPYFEGVWMRPAGEVLEAPASAPAVRLVLEVLRDRYTAACRACDGDERLANLLAAVAGGLREAVEGLDMLEREIARRRSGR